VSSRLRAFVSKKMLQAFHLRVSIPFAAFAPLRPLRETNNNKQQTTNIYASRVAKSASRAPLSASRVAKSASRAHCFEYQFF